MQSPIFWADDFTLDGNTARQIKYDAQKEANLTLESGKIYLKADGRKVLILNPEDTVPLTGTYIQLDSAATTLADVDFENAKLVGKTGQSKPTAVLKSLLGKFQLLEEDESTGVMGFRLPQVGAIHAVLGQWTIPSSKPYTVVLPTGTGKTETMLGVYAAARPEKLLVLVPTDALRTQIAEKFSNYGVLKQFGGVKENTEYPIVGKVGHKFSTKLTARGFAAGCNIVVATPAALNSTDEEIRKVFLEQFTHLFVDEAHHIAAKSWTQLRDSFDKKPIVQFTATPYRSDGKDLGGRVIYNFPLKLAYEKKYFSKINYIPVVDFDDIDKAIAEKAIERLREDLNGGKDHLMMVRSKPIYRAEKILEIYQELAPDLDPVLITSQTPDAEKSLSLKKLADRDSRILVCVDMFGEGFDLPALKVAAIHDPHKTLGVTLQFIGRFARVKDDTLGDASVVINRTDRQHDSRLRELYAEDNDWNYLLHELSANAIGEQLEADDFEDGFTGLPDEISMRSISPKMSTVVYKTNNHTWTPENLEKHFGERLYTKPVPINKEERVAWLVTKEVTPARWGDNKSFDEISYDLYVTYWDKGRGLLYINSSGNDGLFYDVAKALCGDEVKRFHGDDIFRPLATVKRRIAVNVGLLDMLNRDKSFEMLMGNNIDFTSDEKKNKTQTNIFAHGFDEKTAARVTVGVSRKGRIWSHSAALNVKTWTRWCDLIGDKLLDDTISTDDVTSGFMKPEKIEDQRPELVPLLVDWPSEGYLALSEGVRLSLNGQECPLIDVDLTVVNAAKSGPIEFLVSTPDWEVTFELNIAGGEMTFDSKGNNVRYLTPKTERSFVEQLNEYGLKILCENSAVITPELDLFVPNSLPPEFDQDKLLTLDWSETNIKKESQGQSRDRDSIQYKAAEYIQGIDTWDVIVDDDGSGEIADLVAVKIDADKLKVNLVHCKFSKDVTAGARIDDLYELCGQAIKSVARVRDPVLMLTNLIRREINRRKNSNNGVLVGNEEILLALKDQAPFLIPEFTITIVQPGVSKALISKGQLELLSATEGYVSDTGGGTPLKVIIND